jgi:hypothetical protein
MLLTRVVADAPCCAQKRNAIEAISGGTRTTRDTEGVESVEDVLPIGSRRNPIQRIPSD